MKKKIAVILAGAMMISALPMGAMAAENGDTVDLTIMCAYASEDPHGQCGTVLLTAAHQLGKMPSGHPTCMRPQPPQQTGLKFLRRDSYSNPPSIPDPTGSEPDLRW